MELDQLVTCFESLGDSCEFGLVQRQAGAEPLGLLRFAGFTGAVEQRLEELIAALDRDFAGLGDEDTVQIRLEGEPGHQEYIVHETTYGLMYHTFLGPTDVTEATLRRNEAIRLRFLRRKLLADLAAAEKIFVWKANFPIARSRVERLLTALRRHGPARLLWVCAAGDVGGRAGDVERLADGLMRGLVDRFAPYDRMDDISHSAWFAVCEAAWRTLAAPSPPDVDGPVILASLRDVLRAAEADPSVGGIRGVSQLAPAGSYTPAKPVLQDTADLNPDLHAVLRYYFVPKRQDYEAPLKIVLERAVVMGQGAVITQDGKLLKESCWEALEADAVPQGLIKLGPERFHRVAKPTRIVHDPALLLQRPWWRSYRHWLVDAASLLAFATTQLDAAKLQLVIGKEDDPALRKAMLDLIAILAPGARVLEHPDGEAWRFSDLHYITPVAVPPMRMLPDALAALRSRASVIVSHPPAARRRRYFLAGAAGDVPRLINEAEIIAVCAAFGCEVVNPAQHAMADRIALFADAELVIGVKTPQFANVAFCRPQTLVVALSPGDWPDPFYATLAGQTGQRYAEVFGRTVAGSRDATPRDFNIDATRFRRTLASLLHEDAVAVAAPAPAAPPTGGIIAFEAFVPVVSYPDHIGPVHVAVLQNIHQIMQPRSYLEIGVQAKETLLAAECPTLAVDPWMPLDRATLGARAIVSLFRMDSDTFFARHDPVALLGGPIDLAFLDGPRLLFEIILRDFINVERRATADSVVLIHDVAPPDVYMACRDRLDHFRRSRSLHPMWWTGDVWKLVVVLQTYRPDLSIDVFDCSPTGLAMVRRLDSESRILAEQYDRIVRDVAGWSDEDAAFAAYRAGLHLRNTAEISSLLASAGRAAGHA